MGNKRTRILSLDLLRVIACFMVIAMHSPMPTQGSNGMFLSALSYLTSPCIGIFFMVSGALLLPTSDNENGIVFLKKRFGKILLPTLTWTTVYLSYNILTNGQEDTYNLAQSILSIPFSPQGNGVLWFMYTLAGLYLLAPIISPWLRRTTEKELRYYLMLWAITLCYPLLELVVKIETDANGILYYFTGYVGYFVWGYYLRNYGDHIRFWPVSLALAVAIAAPIVVKINGLEIDFYKMFWYLSIFVVIMCIWWWKAILLFFEHIQLTPSIWKGIMIISNLSFGIYLAHIFIMRNILWHCDFIIHIKSYPLQTLVIILSTFLISIILCWGISFLPKSNWIIGIHHKR